MVTVPIRLLKRQHDPNVEHDINLEYYDGTKMR